MRDTVRLRLESLSAAASASLEIAAVLGDGFELALLAELGAEPYIGELLDSQFLAETGPGIAAFRRRIIRAAIYADSNWPRRRQLHGAVAELLDRRGGADLALLAEHRIGAGDRESARGDLLAAARELEEAHAPRDAVRVLTRALELWPASGDVESRLAALEQLGRCAALAGDIPAAARALEQASACARESGMVRPEVSRRLASLYELEGSWERAIGARLRAADEFAAGAHNAEAAADRLAVAAHLQSAGRLTAALEVLVVARLEIARAGTPDLRARLLTLEGQIRAKQGQGEAAVELVREGLGLALIENLVGPAADGYYRLASALEHSSSYPSARDAYRAAFEYCLQRDVAELAQVCFACLAPVMLRTGEWTEAEQVCRHVLAKETGKLPRMVVAGEQGLLQAMRGETRLARRHLETALRFAIENELVGLEIDATYGLARVEDLEGHHELSLARMRSLVNAATRSRSVITRYRRCAGRPHFSGAPNTETRRRAARSAWPR